MTTAKLLGRSKRLGAAGSSGGGTFSGAYVYGTGTVLAPLQAWAASHEAQLTASLSTNYDTDSYWNNTNHEHVIPATSYYRVLALFTAQLISAPTADAQVFAYFAISGSHPVAANWMMSVKGSADVDGILDYEDHFTAGEQIEFWLQNGTSASSLKLLQFAFIIRRVG